jgi:hypothetical protein
MQRGVKTLIVAAAAALVMAPMPARADGFFSPWVGSAFGGAVTATNIDRGHTTWGISAGGMGAGIIGGELDFGFTPSFFGSKDLIGSNAAINLMGNLIVGVPVGGQHGAGIRPYVTAGLGLLRTHADGGTFGNPTSSENGLGWNAGAGAMGYFTDHVGLRGDLRYLRGFNDHDLGFETGDSLAQVRFWRASIGVVFR